MGELCKQLHTGDWCQQGKYIQPQEIKEEGQMGSLPHRKTTVKAKKTVCTKAMKARKNMES